MTHSRAHPPAPPRPSRQSHSHPIPALSTHPSASIHSLPTILHSPMPTPYPHTVHTPTDTCLHSFVYHHLLTHCLLLLLYYTSPLYHRLVYILCPQLYPFLSRSRYRSTSTCAPLPDGRYGPPPPGYHMLTCILLLSQCYLHTVHMSVCTTVLTLLQHPDYRLGFSPCAHHDLSFSPSVCHPGCLRYHQSLTRVHSHSLPVPPPYRSLTLAHRVVPPLVVPVPSLAVSGVRLSCVVPLAGESPLADARLRLTPMVTCCSLSARPHSHPSIHYSCQHPSCTHTCQHSCTHACSHACYQFCPHHAYSTSSNPASITLRA